MRLIKATILSLVLVCIEPIGTCGQSDARDVSLKEYIEARIGALNLAVEKAELQLNLRLEGMNEFRETLRDQASRLTTRVETDLLEKRIRDLEQTRERLEGKMLVYSGMLSVGVSVISALLVITVSKKLKIR